jgi:hypothetical protein
MGRGAFKIKYQSNNNKKDHKISDKIPEKKYNHIYVIQKNSKFIAEFSKNMSNPSPLWGNLDKEIPSPEFKDNSGQEV